MSAYVAALAQQLHGLTEVLVALTGPPPGPPPVRDPALPCDHPPGVRLGLPTLSHPRRSFCRACASFLEE